MSKYIILLLAVFCTLTANGQEDADLKNISSNLAESLPEAEDLSELTERLSFYKKHPLNLNQAKPEQLKELILLSALQISNFYIHLKTSGKLQDLLELQAIDGFDQETISRLLPFVTLGADNPYSRLNFRQLAKGNHEVLVRYGKVLEQQQGYRDLPGSRYLGSPDRLLLKYKYYLNDLIAFSFTGEKDAGETFLSGTNKKGFDFNSISLSMYKAGRIQQLVIGDYSLRFGQGLTLWSGTALGKGPDVAAVAKMDTGLKPYTSANESAFFSGLAATVTLAKYTGINLFVSSRRLDASLTAGKNGEPAMSTISSSGLHRTLAETGHRKNTGQLLYGTALTFNRSSLNLGLITYQSHYQHTFVKGKPLYKQYGFEGRQLLNSGIYYNYTYRNTLLFGEIAHSLPGGWATLTGAMASLSPHTSAVLLYRDYARRHTNFYSMAPGAGSAANERGIYLGLNLRPAPLWDLAFYADLFHFPWLKYRIDKPSSGLEMMGQLSYTKGKIWKALLKLSLKKNEQNEGSGLPVNPVVGVTKYSSRMNLDWKLSRHLNFQNRLEITHYKKGVNPSASGYLIYQDIDYHPLSSRLAGNCRFAFFNTSSYDSRIYAYEDDVLYGSGSGLYNGKGWRTYLNFNFRITRQLRIWAKYAVSFYPAALKTGSGLEEIQGGKKSDMRLQLRYQF